MLNVTYLGTTVLLFDDGADQVLFDAHFTRPSLKQYITGAKAATDTALCDRLIGLYHIERLRAIFISHTHHDHVMDAPYISNRCSAVIYGSESARNVALGGGVPEERIVVFRHGDAFSIGDYRITILKSLHSKPTRFNNDLGVPITEPLVQPASLRDYREGGSYDFFVEHRGKTVLIRPSFNYIDGQLDGIKADVLYLGVAGLAKADASTEKRFFEETVAKVGARLVIPIHWDNFFSPLTRPVRGMPGLIEHTEVVFFKLGKYCRHHDIDYLIQYPCSRIGL